MLSASRPSPLFRVLSASLPTAQAQTAPATTRLHRRSHRVPQPERRWRTRRTGAPSRWRAGPDDAGRAGHRRVSCRRCRQRSSSSTTSPEAAGTRLTTSPSRTSPGSRPRAPGGHAPGSPCAKLAGNVPGLLGHHLPRRAGHTCTSAWSLNYQTSNAPEGLAAPPGTVFMLNESRRVQFYERNLLRSSGIRSDRAGDAGRRRPLADR
mgnify:CR=1 FL=1